VPGTDARHRRSVPTLGTDESCAARARQATDAGKADIRHRLAQTADACRCRTPPAPGTDEGCAAKAMQATDAGKADMGYRPAQKVTHGRE
jgi:hypothetical protein